ncbi:MAG: bifunctional riboflavin kinase/FAD synthetase [Pelagibacteraceae bacterium TMED124]|mgnify:CR=1 FL=1|nr:riboflavin biosynthesis protein RibF [Candidatus Neomarinimicrobiota bacterium]RPG17355.1 MAG: bifunctional riboflavin kinase/FAD synthetase [Pelagibacteraceae bacterium TMED124]
MKVFRSISAIKSISESVLAIGGFDGVHHGHKEILRKLVNESRKAGIPSVLLTFSPVPFSVLSPDLFLGHIDTFNERIKKIKKSGIDILCMLPFNESLRTVTAQNFLNDILINNFNPKTIVVGYDHHFGYKKEGDFNFLKKNASKYSFNLILIKKVKTNTEHNLSSSAIRELLKNGDIASANLLLGSYFTIKGVVIKGQKLGSKIGFPTINIKLDPHKIIPSRGVYIVVAKIFNKKYKAICNIGFSPTFSNKKNIKIEAHVLDFNKDVYGEEVSIEFLDFIRFEKKFQSVEMLKRQILKDKNKCLEYSFKNS